MSQTTLVRKAIKAILASLPQSETTRIVCSSFAACDDSAVSALRVNPRRYLDAQSFGPDYLAVELARKWTGLKTGIDTEEVALLGFLEQEARNKAFNFQDYDFPSVSAQAVQANTAILAASRKIADVLGHFDPIEFASSCSFSSGASYDLTRQFGDQSFKYVRDELEVTRAAYPIAKLVVETSPRWESQGLEIKRVPGSRFATVPKDSTKDRCIVIDPRMNIYLQKGIGSMIRSRLKTVGLDLSDQGVNRHLAYLGSTRNEGNLATLDLSAASDSITYKLVMDLLPYSWFRILDALRSKRVRLTDGTWHELHMFSGMGNGFTFELESLIFWALAQTTIENDHPTTVHDRTCKVYGDDIVVASRHYEAVVRTLIVCGFRVNLQKSFYYGGFRESCGGHYFLGVDVTPFYIKDATDTPMDLIHIANAYHLWCVRFPQFADQDLFDYLCALAQNKARGKMTLVPSRDGLKAGLTWSPIRPTTDKSHVRNLYGKRRVPAHATIVVNAYGAAIIQDNDWNNLGSCYTYTRFTYGTIASEVKPIVGCYLAALQQAGAPTSSVTTFETSMKGPIKTRRVKTSTWCDFSPLFDLPPVFKQFQTLGSGAVHVSESSKTHNFPEFLVYKRSHQVIMRKREPRN